MATLHQVQAALEALVISVVTGLRVRGQAIGVDVGIGWPGEKRLQGIAQGMNSAIAIYDRKIGRNVTRWLPQVVSTTAIPALLTSAISSKMIGVSGTGTVTLGGSIQTGDAVSIVLVNAGVIGVVSSGFQPIPVGAVVVSVAAGNTLAQVASNLAAAVTADPTLSTWVSASATGDVVTLTALSGKGPFDLASNTGNGASQQLEVGRRERQFQIACWVPTEEIRQAVTDPIDVALALSELNYGPTLADGTAARLQYADDYYIEDATLQDVLRRDFLLTMEYPVITMDNLYAILAPELSQYVEYPLPGDV